MGCRLLGWCHGKGDGRADEESVRSLARPEDVRAIRRSLAKRKRRPIRGQTKHGQEIRRLTKPRKLDWNNSTLVTGDIPEEIRKLKSQNGPELQVHGSSNLIQTLLKHDLIDEFRLKIFPITIGQGKRLFG